MVGLSEAWHVIPTGKVWYSVVQYRQVENFTLTAGNISLATHCALNQIIRTPQN